MPAPCPILKASNRAAKQAALIAMHQIGWRWYDTVDMSLARLGKWSDEREANTSHMILGGFKQHGLTSIHWQTTSGLQQCLNRPKDYTMVNSLSHLRSYALKHRPKANPPPVAPPPQIEIDHADIPF